MQGTPTTAYVVGIADSSQVKKEGGTSVNNTLLIVIGVIALILLLVGGFNQALQFLLWVGLILLIVAVVLFIVRMLGGRGRV
jgi:hypothetical protein